MRAKGRDIVELFGYAPDDVGDVATSHFQDKFCPFLGSKCTKTNHDQSIVYGVCSVSNGVQKDAGSEIIICPKRLYAKECEIFNFILECAWVDQPKSLVIGGDLSQLKERALTTNNPVIAFGQNSGKEIQVNSNGQLSMDWVLQSYNVVDGLLSPDDFVGIEVQSIDITGNYRDNWAAYKSLKEGAYEEPINIPDSGHGLNWANVHKRLIPQIIRKGNIYSKMDRCLGFYFIVPDSVYQKFEEVIGDIPTCERPSKSNLSVITFKLGEQNNSGKIRSLEMVRKVHYSLEDIAMAFIRNSGDDAHLDLDANLKSILK